MSAKKRSPSVDYVVYVIVRIAVCFLHAIHFRLACKLSGAIAWLGYHVDRRHRLVALENLRIAFPGRYSEAELDQMVRNIYRHFALLLMEILFLPRLVNASNWRNHLHFRSQEETNRLLGLVLLDRPILFATGHFGNWELACYIMGVLGVPMYAIARPLDNPYVDRFLRDLRERTGQKILAKKGEFDQIEGVLKKGGILGTLADQDAGQRGMFVDFFNRPASTHKALALLAMEHNVPIAVVATVRTGGPLEYTGCLEDVIFPEEYAGKPDALKAITQRYTSALERLVRPYPEQYFWLHRRWKHQPVVKKARKLAA